MDSNFTLGGTVPFEEGSGHHSNNEINQEEIERLAGEDRRTFNENGNDSFKLSSTVECDNEPTDHQIECNTTSQDELAQTEDETVVCQTSDSNSDKEDNDTIKEGNMLVGFTRSIIDNIFMVDPDIDVSLRRSTEVIDKEEKKVRYFEMAPTETTWRNGYHSICTVYENVQTGDTISVVHKRISNYREVLAGLDIPKISPAIFCVIEEDKEKIHMFMELVDPYVSLGGMIRLGKKLGKSGAYYVINIVSKAVNVIHGKRWSHGDLHVDNILLQKIENEIIPRIIDYGYAMELAGNENDESYMGYDISMISEAISNLCISLNEIDDPLLNRFRGDNREVLRNTEDVECLIEETAFEAAIFGN
ncbi:unnamed protein product [Mytilus coruscus]|uniref:Protein kinase domain-containing protein n=1 Tax=Mytilus coruscus TaxID=42192 RepID=A0A6J8ATV6_MYTCO|nr:unnamed protein product [Mytilus coruscus]